MMLLTKVIKTVACCGSAALVLYHPTLQAKEMVACHECRMKRLPKARELPLYEKDDLTAEYDENSSIPLISEISSLRKQVSHYTAYINVFQERAVHAYETGVAHSKSTFDYLKDEENKLQRLLIIASGGLVGLVYARKRGIFKKILYTSLATGLTFSIFYPAVTKEYAQAGWKSSKTQINDMLTKYGGYDTDKMAEDANAKLEFVKSAMKFEFVMQKLNEMFYKNKDALTKNKDALTKQEENDKSSPSKEA